MKTVFKVLLIIGIVFILGIIGVVACTAIGVSTVDEAIKETEKQQEEEAVNSPVNKENYDKIKEGDVISGDGGMTIDEVLEILGEPDNKTQSKTGDITNDIYSWSSPNFESISITFTNGKASHKMYME